MSRSNWLTQCGCFWLDMICQIFRESNPNKPIDHINLLVLWEKRYISQQMHVYSCHFYFYLEPIKCLDLEICVLKCYYCLAEVTSYGIFQSSDETIDQNEDISKSNTTWHILLSCYLKVIFNVMLFVMLTTNIGIKQKGSHGITDFIY